MIDYNFAQDLLEQLEFELEKHDHEIGVRIETQDIRLLTKDYQGVFENQLYCLPIVTSPTTQIVQISNYYYDIYFNGVKEKHPNLIKGSVEQTISKTINNCHGAVSIYAAIQDKIAQLTYNYKKVLQVTKDVDYLNGIKDEERILKNHIIRYTEILASNDKQISFLRGIILNKTISDIILKIYIRFIHLRLKILNPELPSITQNNLIGKNSFQNCYGKAIKKNFVN